MKNVLASLAAFTLLSTLSTSAQFGLTPLSSFGGGDGWLAPGEGGYTFLGTGNNERGLAYGNSHLYLMSRSGGLNLRVLDPLTGMDLGTPLNVTGVSGGTFALSMLAVGGDGAIYGANLTTQSTTSPFKVYRWTTEAAVPTVAYTGDGALAGARLGDTLAAIGSGSSTLLAAGYGSAPAVAGNNGYAIIDPTAGTASRPAFTGTPPNAGDFRLGLSFGDAAHVYGAQGSSLYRYSTFSGAAATLLGSPTIPDPAGASADRLLAYTLLNGVALLAVQSIGDSHVSLYNVSDPTAPVWLLSGNNTSGTLAANANGTGQLTWGEKIINGDGTATQKLYALSSNQGIQAFIVTVPEPGTVALGLLGLAGFLLLRGSRRQA